MVDLTSGKPHCEKLGCDNRKLLGKEYCSQHYNGGNWL